VAGEDRGHYGHGAAGEGSRHRGDRADFEDQIQFAVVLDEDPGREFGLMRQPGHRFFYSPEEVEPVTGGDFA
jgi:hypothetical protein